MKDEEIEIEEPTGKFIIDNLPFEKRFQTANGMYIHYSDVCQLLKKYHENKVKKLNKADVSGMLPLTENAKKKLEYINGSCIARDFPKEQPTKEWAGAVLDLLEELGLGNYR